ncbi:MAG TPA: hypothetical protein VK909_03355 [Anaerolineales bacterium]|nr:hypothetical protein [Anaerolineales bacterium]
MEQTNQLRSNHGERFVEKRRSDERMKPPANLVAYRNSKRRLEWASDQIARANRDLGEMAAFIAASLTTVTAVQAVINIAIDRLGLAKEILQIAFNTYLGILIFILVVGSLRFIRIMYRRTRAETEIDRAKQRIYEFDEVKDSLKPEE